MNFKYTANTLKKMEQLFEESCYRVRYERGRFNSGYCVLEDKKVVVINKFLDYEGKINVLLELLQEVNIRESELSGEMLKWYRQITQSGQVSSASVQTKMNL